MADENEIIQVEVTFPLPEEHVKALKSIKEALGTPVPDQLRAGIDAHITREMAAPDFEERYARALAQGDADVTRLLEVANRPR